MSTEHRDPIGAEPRVVELPGLLGGTDGNAYLELQLAIDRARKIRDTFGTLGAGSLMIIERAVAVSGRDALGAVVRKHSHLPGYTHAVLGDSRGYLLTSLDRLRAAVEDDDHHDDDLDELFSHLGGLRIKAVQHSELARLRPGHGPVVVLDGISVKGVVAGAHRGQHGVPPTSAAAPPAPLGVPAATDIGDFRAFAAVGAPESVAGGTEFTLSVGFSLDGVAADEIVLPDAPPVIDFDVQIIGIGFTFPDGVRRSLSVNRIDPTTATTTFTVRASKVTATTDGTLVVAFARDGIACGRSLRVVQIRPSTRRSNKKVVQPANGLVAEATKGQAPDLTVHIVVGAGSEVQWRFLTPHVEVVLPTDDVVRPLTQDSARAFAQDMLQRLQIKEGTEWLAYHVRGMCQEITKVVPAEFWAALESVWRVCARKQQVPTLLLITDDPFVPWELAWLSDDNVDVTLLPAAFDGASLASVWHVGRWIETTVHSRYKPDRPAWPPADAIDMAGMVVVTGGYAEDAKGGLPQATEESKEIAERYQAVQLSDDAGMLQVLDNRVLDASGAAMQPSVVHFAMHGRGDDVSRPLDVHLAPASGRGVDPLDLADAAMSEKSRPLVFLNACQVAESGISLSGYSGLPEAFLTGGCRACIAPLWTVDDTVAHRFAVEFYRRTIDDGVPVGQALTELRQWFDTEAGAGTVTPLAYVYYGHPGLKLTAAR